MPRKRAIGSGIGAKWTTFSGSRAIDVLPGRRAARLIRVADELRVDLRPGPRAGDDRHPVRPQSLKQVRAPPDAVEVPGKVGVLHHPGQQIAGRRARPGRLEDRELLRAEQVAGTAVAL
jgi:IS4 transposase